MFHYLSGFLHLNECYRCLILFKYLKIEKKGILLFIENQNAMIIELIYFISYFNFKLSFVFKILFQYCFTEHNISPNLVYVKWMNLRK